MRDCCKTNGFYLIDDIAKEKIKEQEHIKSWISHREKTLLPERKSVAGI